MEPYTPLIENTRTSNYRKYAFRTVLVLYTTYIVLSIFWLVSDPYPDREYTCDCLIAKPDILNLTMINSTLLCCTFPEPVFCLTPNFLYPSYTDVLGILLIVSSVGFLIMNCGFVAKELEIHFSKIEKWITFILFMTAFITYPIFVFSFIMSSSSKHKSGC